MGSTAAIVICELWNISFRMQVITCPRKIPQHSRPQSGKLHPDLRSSILCFFQGKGRQKSSERQFSNSTHYWFGLHCGAGLLEGALSNLHKQIGAEGPPSWWHWIIYPGGALPEIIG